MCLDFGGAADKSWASPRGGTGGPENTYVYSSAAFLFCISCAGAGKTDPPRQLKLNGNNQYALRHHGSPGIHGPTFGRGHDLVIYGQPRRVGGTGGSELGVTYTCPPGQYKSAACKNYLGGAKFFTVADYEVFVIQTK